MPLWQTEVICQSLDRMDSKGIINGENPMKFANPLFMLQIALSSFWSTTMHHLLKPLGHCTFFCHILGGMLADPICFGVLTSYWEALFPPANIFSFEIVQNIGIIFYIFLVGLKLDLRGVSAFTKKELITGLLLFLVPFIISLPCAYMLRKHTTDKHIGSMLIHVAILESTCSVHVIVAVLSDLNLLNSELGRLAVSSSLVSNVIAYIVMVLYSLKPLQIAQDNVGLILLIIIVAFLMRPLILLIIRQTPEGHNLKEDHMAILFIMLLVCVWFGDAGKHRLEGSLLLGLVVPAGPPLASNMEDRIHVFYTGVLLPLYCVAITGIARLNEIQLRHLVVVGPVILIAFFGKFGAVMLSSLFFKIPFREALPLALVMCSQGIMDVQYMRQKFFLGNIDTEVYTVMLFYAFLTAGIITPVVSIIYNPSRRFLTCQRGSIEETSGNTELRILACVYNEETAPTMINLIDVSNSKSGSPLCVYLLHLLELRGRVRPLLVAHDPNKPDQTHYTRSEHIMHAFESYEQLTRGIFSLQCFTVMSPFASMHEDICTVALENKASLIIIPFHRHLGCDGMVQFNTQFRHVNSNVLAVAPCTVGVLINLSSSSSNASSIETGSGSLYCVAVIFMGGPDDREALTYGMRMVEHAHVRLTVLRISAPDDISYGCQDGILNNNIWDQFVNDYLQRESVTCTEVVVTDGVGTLTVIKELKFFDLIMVGKHHPSESPVVSGLSWWDKFPELGYLGQVLATLDTGMDTAVLILQQNPNASGYFLEPITCNFHSTIDI